MKRALGCVNLLASDVSILNFDADHAIFIFYSQ